MRKPIPHAPRGPGRQREKRLRKALADVPPDLDLGDIYRLNTTQEGRAWTFEARGLSDEERKIVESALDATGLKPAWSVRVYDQRIRRVSPQLGELCRMGVDPSQILEAVSSEKEEAQRLAAKALQPLVSRIGARLRELKAFIRHAERLRLAVVEIRREAEPQLSILEKARAIVKKYLAQTARLTRERRPPEISPQVHRLVDLFLKAGWSHRQAYRRTAQFLDAWYANPSLELTEEHIRLRYRCARRSR